MGKKEGEIAALAELAPLATFGDPITGYMEYIDPPNWRTKWDSNAPGYYPGSKGLNVGAWRWTFMGAQPSPATGADSVFNPPVGAIDPSLKLDKGDYCQLKASKRKFRILEERKDEQNNFEELCKFDDDNRNPVWLPHSWLVGEVNILEKA